MGGSIEMGTAFEKERTRMKKKQGKRVYALIPLDLADNGVLDDNHQNVTVTLHGRTTDGTLIEGTDTIDAFFAGKALKDALSSL